MRILQTALSSISVFNREIMFSISFSSPLASRSICRSRNVLRLRSPSIPKQKRPVFTRTQIETKESITMESTTLKQLASLQQGSDIRGIAMDGIKHT